METVALKNGNHGGSISGVKRPRSEISAASDSWIVKASRESHNCVNPVRSCEEKYFRDAMEKRDRTKSFIKLSIGK